MSIERLALTDLVQDGTTFAVNNNGQDYRALGSTVLKWVQAGTSSVDGKRLQYAAPNATGFTVLVNDSNKSVWLVLTPLAAYVTGAITLPSVLNCVESQEILVNCTQSVTALTINGNGSTVVGAPTTLAANSFFTLRFEPVLKVWYRVG
jgi:hypothetical protein